VIPWDQVPHDDGRPRLYLGPPAICGKPEVAVDLSECLQSVSVQGPPVAFVRLPEEIRVLVAAMAKHLPGPVASVLVLVHPDLEVGDVPASRAAWHCDGVHGQRGDYVMWQVGVASTLFLDGEQELRAGDQPRTWECPQRTIIRYTGQHLHTARPAETSGARLLVKLSTVGPSRVKVGVAPRSRLP